MANTKIYIHEFVDIILQNRAAYIMHMTEGWEPIGRERNMKCFGVWATVGSSERWPEDDEHLGARRHSRHGPEPGDRVQ